MIIKPKDVQISDILVFMLNDGRNTIVKSHITKIYKRRNKDIDLYGYHEILHSVTPLEYYLVTIIRNTLPTLYHIERPTNEVIEKLDIYDTLEKMLQA